MPFLYSIFLLVIATINSVVATTANSPKPASVQGRTTTTKQRYMYFINHTGWTAKNVY